MSKLQRNAFVGISLLLLVTSPANAEETYELDIADQELSSALKLFAEQSGLQVVYFADLANGKRTKGVHGTYSADAALAELLHDTELTHSTIDDRTFSIAAPSTAVTEEAEDPGNSQPASSLLLMAQTRTPAPKAQTDSTKSDTDDEEVLQLENIIVIGTNIRGIAPDSSPSLIFDREDIDRSGFGTVSEFVQSLPQNFGGGSNADTQRGLPNDRTAADNFTSGSSVNLRGLGSGSTLVLLNGNRLAPTGTLGDFVDISMIPLSAVERVEVLTDGASAIYGADAIAGVVNFVLRQDYDGAETFLRFGSVTEGSLNEYRAGQTFGKNWDTGNALVSYELFHRDALDAVDRNFSSGVPMPTNLLPGQESHSVLLTGSQQLGDRLTLRGHGTFSQRDGDDTFTDSGGITNFTDSRSKQYGGTVGADIELWSDWQLAVSGSYNKVTSFVDRTGRFPLQLEIDSDIRSVDGKVDGTLFRLSGGDVKIATGLGYREETHSALQGGNASRQDERNVYAAFAEVFIPIIGAHNRVQAAERLELTLAVRYDDYSDFGDTLNPKIGLLWSPVDGLNFRGTYSTSFNPPNLGDTGVAGGNVTVFNAPDPASPTGSSLVVADFRAPDLGPETSTAWTAGFDHTRDVGPGDLELSMTWFDISFEDRIGTAGIAFFFLNDPVVFAPLITADPDPALTAALVASAPSFFDFSGFGGPVWTMPGDEDFIVDGRLSNLATADTSGLDVNLTYSVDGDNGQLRFGLNGNYLFKQEKKITSNAPIFDVVDTVFNPVDLRLRGSASWSSDGWSASTFVDYVDSYTDDRNVSGMGDVPVDSWTTVDLSLSYDTGEEAGELLDNTRFAFSVRNLFNQDPPQMEIAFGAEASFDATNASPLGRFIAFQITKAW